MASRSGTNQTVTAATAADTVAEATSDAGRRGGCEASITSTAEEVTLNCLMNARYHSAREAFLDSVHRWFMFGIIAAGAGSVSSLLFDAAPVLHAVLPVIAVLLSAADLTFDLSNRARIHALMKRRYFELIADMREGTKTPEAAEACTHRYSADEEPAYQALLMGAWNAAQEMVYGHEAKLVAIPPSHRWFQNIRRFEGQNYPLVTTT